MGAYLNSVKQYELYKIETEETEESEGGPYSGGTYSTGKRQKVCFEISSQAG